jgi:hypothetical protein
MRTWIGIAVVVALGLTWSIAVMFEEACDSKGISRRKIRQLEDRSF